MKKIISKKRNMAEKEMMQRVVVSGTSMYPLLLPDDIAIVAQGEEFSLGSTLVYSYKSEGYLIHRLLRISKGRYYCKGDNSFRIEKVKEKNLLGQVVFVKRGNQTFVPPKVDDKFIKMSLEIGKKFKIIGRKIMSTDLCLEYRELYLDGNAKPEYTRKD